ncbi:MAG TPA: deoxyribodipyrimidine photo-lyase [Bryobacteraceae bacterium]|nr:deoxyribodipyrimidine photo-lyase [Bryobacteraceae bacterium]
MDERVRALNSPPQRSGGRYVLYWMQMNRRVAGNHALAFAARLANDRGLPLLVYEGLTYRYPQANDRIHTFMLEGVPETARRLRDRGIGYVFYPRRTPEDRNDTLYVLARDAAAVVTDDYPVFITAGHNRTVPDRIGVAYYAVDASCVVPMTLIEKRQAGAYTIRPRIRRFLADHLRPVELPRVRAWRGAVADFHTEVTDDGVAGLVASCTVDHSVAPSPEYRGGALEAERRLEEFVHNRLARYENERNEPSARVNSNLSPYLHFGQISAIDVALRAQDYAADHRINAEPFLDELIVRRELAFNFCRYAERPDSLDELPAWARSTLRDHADDARPQMYSREDLIAARTYDPLWNATQREMLATGTIASYYRMYWGKKIIEWSATQEEALATMLHIHERWALDGRDPNTYANCLWCFGLHDRPFGERAIFGKVRYMSYAGMRRKTDVEAYIRQVDSLPVQTPRDRGLPPLY